ncbi:MAG TPA: hypothetical protein VFJ82_15165, partial [Longimicrobium sp.]|nr:hypothetical protein [Longimicrobium sp.]
YQTALKRYKWWLDDLPSSPAQEVTSAHALRLRRKGMADASRAADHARKLAEEAQRLADEKRARLLHAAGRDRNPAVARHRDADPRGGSLSLHAFPEDAADARTVLMVGAAGDPAAGTRFGFDVGAAEVVPLLEGRLGPPLGSPATLADALERFEAWQRNERAARTARRRRREIDRVADELRACGARLTATPLPVQAPAAELRVDTVDLRMAIEWCEAPHNERLRALYHTASVPYTFACELEASPTRWDAASRELDRTLSARVAEKAARWFYKNGLGAGQVDDVSYEQGRALLDPDGAAAEADWHTHDLLVHHERPVPVDVKNARPQRVPREEFQRRLRAGSTRSPVHYVEHCIRRFKKDSEHRDVAIAGVYSQYRTAAQLIGGDYRPDGTPLFLGHTTRRRIERLEEAFGSPLLKVELATPVRGGDRLFVPPWMYDYPEQVHGHRDEALEPVAGLAAAAPELVTSPGLGQWALFLAAGVMRPESAAVEALEWPWRSFVGWLAALPAARRRSLPVLYLGVLRHFLETVAAVARRAPGGGARLADFVDPWRYATFLYLPDGAPEWPLGVYDPLCTVDSLIGSLAILVATRPEVLLRFRRFRFRQTGVLTARANGDSHATTIMFPYCGGGCGRENLVLGADGTESCEECGLLVCPNAWCRFCCDGCGHRRAERIAAATPTRRAAAPRRPHAGIADDLPFP